MRLPSLLLVMLFPCSQPALPGPPPAWIDAEHTAQVDRTRGVDPGVDYASLLEIGPWDDRNYLSTRVDVALLAPDEQHLGGPLTALSGSPCKGRDPCCVKDGASATR